MMETLGSAILLGILCLGAVVWDTSSIEPLGPVKDLPLMVGALLLLPWLASRGGFMKVVNAPLVRSLLALLLATVISAVGAINMPAAREEILRLGCLVIVALASMQVSWTAGRLRVLALLALLGAGVNAALVLAEHQDLGWKFFTRENRLLGLFSHQNDLAQFLSIVILMGFVGMPSEAPHSPRGGDVLRCLLMSLASIALVLTLSRGAWLGTLAGLAFLLWGRSGVVADVKLRALPLVAMVLGISLGALLVMGDATGEKNLSPLKTKSDLKALTKDSGRHELYTHSLLAFREHPILGSGPGNYPVIYQKTDRTRTEYVRYAHSDPLQWLVETGLVGGLAALGVAFVVWKRMWTAQGDVRVVAATLVVTAVHSLVSYPLYKCIPAAWAFWALGVLAWKEGVACYAPTQRQSVKTHHGVGAQHAAPIIAMIISIFLIPTVLAPWRASRLQKEAHIPLQTPPTSPWDAMDRHRKVAEGLERARELQPHDPAILWTLAVSYLQAGEKDRGESVLIRLEELTPYNDRVHILLARLAAERGDQASRLAQLDRAFAVIPDSRPLLDEMWAMLDWSDIDNREDRRSRLTEAYKRQGWWREREPELLAELGETASLSDLIHAQVMLSDRALVSPDPETLARLGLTQYRLGNIPESLTTYGQALEALDAHVERWRDRPDLLLRILMAKGNCLVQLGDPEKALPVFRRGRQSYPREPRFLDQELRLLMESGCWSEVAGAIQQAVESGGDEKMVRLRSAELLALWNGGSEIGLLEALDQYRILVDRVGDGKILLARGRFYLEKMGDAEAAREDLQRALELPLDEMNRQEALKLLKSIP